MFFAFDNVDAAFLKNTLMVLFALAVGAGGYAAWADRRDKKRKAEQMGEQRRASPSRRIPNVRENVCEFKMSEVTRRLDDHDDEIEELRVAMKAEDDKINARLSITFESIQRSLGRIEGKLDGKENPPT